MNFGGNYYTEDEIKNAGFKKIGNNVKIHSRASLYVIENISIGDNVRIDDFTVIIGTGGVEIGSHIQICTHCFLGGTHGITLKDFCTLAPGVKIFSASDDYSGTKMTNPTLPSNFHGGASGKVTLEKHVIIGTNSIVLPDCTIGEGVAVGALSLVKTNLLQWNIYAGVPARPIKERKKDLLLLEKAIFERN